MAGHCCRTALPQPGAAYRSPAASRPPGGGSGATPPPLQKCAGQQAIATSSSSSSCGPHRYVQRAVTCSSFSSNGSSTTTARVADPTYYQLLGVAPSASQADLKAAYRSLALQLHPDVNSAADATERFAEVANAYDVLSDPDSRSLYDRFGPEGMKGRAGAAAGSGNASRFWEEFKPYKRENKKTRARDASTASYGSSSFSSMDEPAAAAAAEGPAQQPGRGSGGGGDRWAGMPTAGAVVEYPLSQLVQDELQDGRSHGVGLLVGRNIDRGDAKRLPPEVLDLCEVEPMRQEEEGSTRWIPDELSPSAFPRLGELRVVAVDSFDQRFDVWVITAPLSEGCGGPELPEEIIL